LTCLSSLSLFCLSSSHRFGSLDSSYVLVDGKIKTNVKGLVYSIVPSAGTSGDLVLTMDAHTENGANQLSTSNRAVWESMSTWTKAGSMTLDSSFLYLDGAEVNWNSKGLMNYGENKYAMRVNNYDLNAMENFLCHGNGGYGGDFMRWFVSLDLFSLFSCTVGG
jgi:hypothetical protein